MAIIPKTALQSNMDVSVTPIVPSSINILLDDFGKTMDLLREEVMALNDLLNQVLRPEPARLKECCKDNTDKELMKAPLELWLDEQILIAKSCISRIQEYRERCAI